MYRVITKYHDGRSSRPIVERGPWHDSRAIAEDWADLLHQHGYNTEIESQYGPPVANDNHDLAAALSSMA